MKQINIGYCMEKDRKMHTCDVVEIQLLPHPNADSLSIVKIGDFQCLVRTDDWKDGDLAVYIPPDSIVPETEMFAFLGAHRRIKARKLRGEYSVGLLVPAPFGAKIGDNCMEQLGIIHYEPQVHGSFTTGGDNVAAPVGIFPVYDVDNFRKYSRLFEDGEEVIVTEKIHGANARFVCIDGEMFVGSRKNWKKEDPNNLWWKAIAKNPEIEAWCRAHSGLALYGEVYGQVQNLKYGAGPGEILFAAFDILRETKWLNFDEAREIGDSLPWVPLIYRGPFNKEKIFEFAEENSSYPLAKHCREGVVIKPIRERWDSHLGRVQLKVVGNRYLSKS